MTVGDFKTSERLWNSIGCFVVVEILHTRTKLTQATPAWRQRTPARDNIYLASLLTKKTVWYFINDSTYKTVPLRSQTRRSGNFDSCQTNILNTVENTYFMYDYILSALNLIIVISARIHTWQSDVWFVKYSRRFVLDTDNFGIKRVRNKYTS